MVKETDYVTVGTDEIFYSSAVSAADRTNKSSGCVSISELIEQIAEICTCFLHSLNCLIPLAAAVAGDAGATASTNSLYISETYFS